MTTAEMVSPAKPSVSSVPSSDKTFAVPSVPSSVKPSVKPSVPSVMPSVPSVKPSVPSVKPLATPRPSSRPGSPVGLKRKEIPKNREIIELSTPTLPVSSDQSGQSVGEESKQITEQSEQSEQSDPKKNKKVVEESVEDDEDESLDATDKCNGKKRKARDSAIVTKERETKKKKKKNKSASSPNSSSFDERQIRRANKMFITLISTHIDQISHRLNEYLRMGYSIDNVIMDLRKIYENLNVIEESEPDESKLSNIIIRLQRIIAFGNLALQEQPKYSLLNVTYHNIGF